MSMENRLRVLVVDNVADMADSLKCLVDLWGYDAEVFYDGAKALAAADFYRPHVVLLDIGLPGMDGFQVARGIRERLELQDVLIVGMTGHGGETYRVRAREMGFDHYLLKPADPDRLRELLAARAEQLRLSWAPRADSNEVSASWEALGRRDRVPVE